MDGQINFYSAQTQQNNLDQEMSASPKFDEYQMRAHNQN